MTEQELNFIKEISLWVISILGLIASLIALTWNIIRDLIKDRTKLELNVKFGGLVAVKGFPSAMFVRKGAIPDKTIPDERILFSIVNSGRRPVMIEAIGANYKNNMLSFFAGKQAMHIVAGELPKMLQPYEVFNHKDCIDDNVKKIFEEMMKGRIKHFFVRDTKGKQWKNSNKNMKALLNDFSKGDKPLKNYIQ